MVINLILFVFFKHINLQNIKGLKKMKAYEEQKKTLEHLKIKFCNNCYTHLKNVIGHAVILTNFYNHSFGDSNLIFES